MKLRKILAAMLVMPLFLAISHAAEKPAAKVAEKKPSLAYYYFDG